MNGIFTDNVVLYIAAQVWAASPEHDMRKRMAIKAMMMFTFLMGTSYYLKRHKWSMIKSRKIIFTPKA